MFGMTRKRDYWYNYTACMCNYICDSLFLAEALLTDHS
jgi:hypothetical protein